MVFLCSVSLSVAMNSQFFYFIFFIYSSILFILYITVFSFVYSSTSNVIHSCRQMSIATHNNVCMKMDVQIGIGNMCLSSLLHINMFLSYHCYKILQLYSIITCTIDGLGGVECVFTLYEHKLLILCITHKLKCTISSHVSTALMLHCNQHIFCVTFQI